MEIRESLRWRVSDNPLDVIRAAIRGETVKDAIAALETLSEEAQKTSKTMTEAGFEVRDRHKYLLAESLMQLKADVDAAKGASPHAQPILLQQAINSLLTYVNYIPGATIAAADTGGKNEGRIRNKLLAHERNEEDLKKNELRANLLGLLDLKEVEEDQRLALLKNHLELVKTAYPSPGRNPDLVAATWRCLRSGRRSSGKRTSNPGLRRSKLRRSKLSDHGCDLCG